MMAQTQKARNASGSSGARMASEMAKNPTTAAMSAKHSTIGSRAMATAALKTKRSRMNGRASSANGSARMASGNVSSANRTPNTIRNGNVSSQNMGEEPPE